MKKGFFKRYRNESNQQNKKPPLDSDKDSNPHGILNLAKNLSSALIQWNRAGRPTVNNEQWKKRLSICRQCQFWQEVGNSQIARCKKCGCSSGKLLLSTSKCPLNPPKWGPEPH
tara:strand:+ start:952 stop:1293 length:342 start_codon:yes stop_codon:yes gene_type:complete